MNPVELDTIALDAEADRIFAESPIESATATGAGDPVPELGHTGLGSWNEVTPGLVAAADVLLLPQWHLADEEKAQLAGALGGVLDQLFPGGMNDPRWAPYLRLAAVSVAIVVTHRDPTTGKLPALGPKRLEKPDAAKDGAGVDRKAA
jgi:hypothetical protein